VSQIEAFEICPYGRQPNLKELKELFPGGIYPSKMELDEVTSDIPDLKKQIKELKKELKELRALVSPKEKKTKDTDSQESSEEAEQ
jgi:hypothetical protein